jgi:hypothetical protein
MLMFIILVALLAITPFFLYAAARMLCCLVFIWLIISAGWQIPSDAASPFLQDWRSFAVVTTSAVYDIVDNINSRRRWR